LILALVIFYFPFWLYTYSQKRGSCSQVELAEQEAELADDHLSHPKKMVLNIPNKTPKGIGAECIPKGAFCPVVSHQGRSSRN